MKNTKSNRTVKYLIFFTTSLCINGFLYVLYFKLLDNYNNFYFCNDLKVFTFEIFNNEIKLDFPFTCDSEYYLGFRSLAEIIKNNFDYQFRPIYFLLINLLSQFVKLFFLNDSIFIYIFSQIIFHTLIINISFWLMISALKEKFNPKLTFLIFFTFHLNPIYKWGYIDPSHQTLTILNFYLALYIVQKKSYFNNSNQYMFSLIFGFLSLANKVFFLTFFIYCLVIFFGKKNDLVTFIVTKFSVLLGIFYFPTFAYRRLILYLGYTPFDSSTEFWGHFVWIKKFLLGIQTSGGSWYCQTIPENFICYFEDFFKVLIYLFVPLAYIIIKFLIIYFSNLLNDDKSNIKFLFLIFMLNFLFWSLMGWYPPLRLNLYSVFPFIFTLFVILLKYSTLKVQMISLLNTIVYLLSLKHWNFPSIVDFGLVQKSTLLILIFLIISDLHYAKSKI